MGALSSSADRQLSEERQGDLQGTSVSLASLTEVVGPIAATSVCAASPPSAAGLVWLVGAGLYVLCVPVISRQMAGPRGKMVEAG